MIVTQTPEGIELLTALMLQSQRPLLFSGAGISTESGIPDFRGPSGFWKTNKPILFQDFIGSAEVRLQAWKGHFAARQMMTDAEPNAGHIAVAALMRRWPESWLITQNVDNLHQNAGCEEHRVIEIHGNATYALCLSCDKRYETEQVRQMLEKEEKAPQCTECGGIIKTATISFGQPMPEKKTLHSFALSSNCDLFLCLGSSLVVEPAASMPATALSHGAKLAIVNLEPTPLDELADLVIQAPLGEVLRGLVLAIEQKTRN